MADTTTKEEYTYRVDIPVVFNEEPVQRVQPRKRIVRKRGHER